MKDMGEILAERLASLRGLHSQIARETGIDQTTISRIANGDHSPRIDTAGKLFEWINAAEVTGRTKGYKARSKRNSRKSSVV